MRWEIRQTTKEKIMGIFSRQPFSGRRPSMTYRTGITLLRSVMTISLKKFPFLWKSKKQVKF